MTALDALRLARTADTRDDLVRQMALSSVLAYLESTLVQCLSCGERVDPVTLTALCDLPDGEPDDTREACETCAKASLRPTLRVVRDESLPYVPDAELPF